jgi:hypothetical protein
MFLLAALHFFTEDSFPHVLEPCWCVIPLHWPHSASYNPVSVHADHPFAFFTRAHTHLCIHSHTNTHEHTRTRTHFYNRTSIRTYTHLHTRAHAHIHVHSRTTYRDLCCLLVLDSLASTPYALVHTRTTVHTHMHVQARTQTSIQAHTNIPTHAHTHMHTHTYTQRHTHTSTDTCIPTHTHTHAHTHIGAHTHEHTDAHIGTYMSILCPGFGERRANLLTMKPIPDIPMNVPFTFCNKQPLGRSLSEPWAFFRRTQPEELGVHAMLFRPMGQVQCR